MNKQTEVAVEFIKLKIVVEFPEDIEHYKIGVSKSDLGYDIIEIMYNGFIPYWWIKAVASETEPYFGGAVVGKNITTGTLKNCGVISHALIERYNILADSRSNSYLDDPSLLIAAHVAADHQDRVYYLYVHPWDQDSVTYNEYVQSTQGGK